MSGGETSLHRVVIVVARPVGGADAMPVNLLVDGAPEGVGKIPVLLKDLAPHIDINVPDAAGIYVFEGHARWYETASLWHGFAQIADYVGNWRAADLGDLEDLIAIPQEDADGSCPVCYSEWHQERDIEEEEG